MTAPDDPPHAHELVPLRPSGRAVEAVDVSLGVGLAAWTVASRVAAVAVAVGRPVVRVMLRPPLVDPALTPEAWLRRLARQGGEVRVRTGVEVEELANRLVPAVTRAVVERIDLTELVLQNVDLARVVEEVLDRIDLTELVIERVDLDRVASELDVDAVAARLDLVGIANYVVDEIDLTEIIRMSTGSVATEAVRGVRMQSIEADAQLQRIVDRVLLRRRARRTEAPSERDGAGDD